MKLKTRNAQKDEERNIIEMSKMIQNRGKIANCFNLDCIWRHMLPAIFFVHNGIVVSTSHGVKTMNMNGG